MSMFTDKDLYTPNGIARSRSLFKEVCTGDDEPIFTLGREKGEGYVCLRNLFISLTVDDPSEDTFVETVFGDYKVWTKIKESSWFQPYYQEWQEIATIKRKSKAFGVLTKEVEEGGRNAYQAAKYLIEEPWKGRTKQASTERKKTTEEAYTNVKGDVSRLKEAGLIN